MRRTTTRRTTPRRTGRPAVLAALSAALIAAPLLPIGAPARAAVGSPVPTGSYAFAAHLRIGDGERTRACSGVLVAPQWVATAASCLTDGPLPGGVVAPGAPALKTVATVGRADLTATTGGHVAEVTELVPRVGRDLVLARLATPATGIQPVAVASEPAAAGDTLKVAGYGRTKTEWVPDRLHVASFAVNTVDATTFAITGSSAGDAICQGDSGGPVLRERAGALELVGISSRSWQGGCLGVTETRNGALAVRADALVGASRLTAGQRLASGDTLASTAATLTMRADGDLVVAAKAGNVLWSTRTAGNAGATARFGADGNLVVRDAADTATLWQSGTAAGGGSVVLQERGNLVVRDAQGASRWSNGSAVRNDFDGSGRADMVEWYDYPDDSDAMHVFRGSPSGALDAPTTSFTTGPGNWSVNQMKRMSGDYNGDGRADLAVFYGYGDGSVKLWTFLGRSDGTFETPFPSWSAPPGHWEFSRARFHSGDFNGDGRDDLVAWYDYWAGHDTMFTFLSDERGGFPATAPFVGWTVPAGRWTASDAKYTTGDFNGDGRDDVAALYRYGDQAVKLWTFLATPSGGFQDGRLAWVADTWGPLARTDVHSGDFDGDGRDDLGLWFDYEAGHDAFHTLKGNADGTVGSYRVALNLPAGEVSRQNLRLVVGDYNGDGRDDLGAMYGYGDGERMLTWPALADGSLAPTATSGWINGRPEWWELSRVNFVDRYTNG
ncbi:FG-GAP-like repeat-containing protein [Streptomyces sp. NPDC048606]|uniref:FG-GAP-like repeat-containing protein n=1 Tax=Streptomyces sp. NPDC048606 TaxID=3154726 RepID=UPI0034485E75